MIHAGSREGAVSPVVGVMLMLTITVMIAAVVSVFTGGISDTGEKVPQASFKVRVNLDENRTYFDHAGGDPVSLTDIKVAFISGERKIAISRTDIGKTCINFTQVGDAGTTIMAGDTFFIEGETPSNANDGSGLKFGSLKLHKESEITWMVIDTRSSQTVSTGSLYL